MKLGLQKLQVSSGIAKIHMVTAPVAQWIEQLGSNESVGGSNPSGSTKYFEAEIY